MTNVVERARAALEGVTDSPWEQNGNNGVHTPGGKCIAITDGYELLPHGKPVRKANAEFIAAARSLVPELIAELERLHSWSGIISLLDEHYPESVFPTMDDRPDRDTGPRIISLIRQINLLRGEPL